MGIGFSSELERLRSDKERRNRNEDAQKHRVHQHQLDKEHTRHRAKFDLQRDRGALTNTKELLGDPLVRPFIQLVGEFVAEHTKHVKSSRKRREQRFKEDRDYMHSPHDNGRGHNKGKNPHHSPRGGVGGKYPPPGPPRGNFDPGDDGNDDSAYGGRGMRRPYPRSDHRDDRRRRPHHRDPRPRHPDQVARYPMHGALGPGDGPFPPPDRRYPRGPKRDRGGHHAHGRDFGGGARAARHERGKGWGSGSGFGEEGPGPGPGSGQGSGSRMGGEGGSHAGSEHAYGGQRGMPPGRG